MKKIIFIVLCLLPIPSFANESKKDPFFVFGDLFVWQVREGGADNWGQSISPRGPNQTISLLEAPFEWRPGFRVGAGYRDYKKQWDARAYWTRYQTKSINRASGNIYSAFLGNFFANNTNGVNFGPFYDTGDMTWNFLFNTIDLELGYTSSPDPVLTLRPFIGLKSAFINQEINTNWQTPRTTFLGIPIPITSFSTANETLKQDFSGVGPSVGIDTTWNLYKDEDTNWNLFGDVSGALLWGNWRFSDLYQNNTPISIAVNLADINGAAPVLRGTIGLEWDGRLFNKDFNVRLGYEAQAWFDHVQYYLLNGGRLNNLMSLQGGTLNVGIHF